MHILRVPKWFQVIPSVLLPLKFQRALSLNCLCLRCFWSHKLNPILSSKPMTQVKKWSFQPLDFRVFQVEFWGEKIFQKPVFPYLLMRVLYLTKAIGVFSQFEWSFVFFQYVSSAVYFTWLAFKVLWGLMQKWSHPLMPSFSFKQQYRVRLHL